MILQVFSKLGDFYDSMLMHIASKAGGSRHTTKHRLMLTKGLLRSKNWRTEKKKSRQQIMDDNTQRKKKNEFFYV